MKKILVLVVLLCITYGANAQLLWKVSGKDLAKPSYVFGTHHLAPLSITDSIPGFKQAMNETEQVYGEIVMEEMQSPINMQKMQQAIMLPGDTTLHTLFNSAQYDSVAVKIKQLMEVELQMFDKIKPAFLTAQISALIAMKTVEGFNPQQQLDGWIQSEAQKKGKAVAGLETMDFQMGVLFGTQTLQRQADQLLCTVMNLNKAEQQTRRMSAAYMKQDLKQLMEIVEEKQGNSCDALPEEEEALIYRRNANWAEVMPAIMKEKATFFAVGSGHLAGERGILNLLSKQGYTIEAVK